MNNKKLISLKCLVLILFSCTQFTPVEIKEEELDLNSFNIITWNLKNFPLHPLTPAHAANIIDTLLPDILALQEIRSLPDFQSITNFLSGWSGYRSGGNSSWQELAFIWNSSTINNPIFYEIYTENSTAFPRPPLVMECNWGSTEFIIINNHLKCCGDGFLDQNNENDEENRRLQAIVLLDEYISEHFSQKNVILVGDLNDILTDSQENNIFNIFFNQPEKFSFVDFDIALGPVENWSYPSWPSHIDHILISNELFDVYNQSGSVKTLNIEDNFQTGMNAYSNYLSDHRPIQLKLIFQ